MADFGFLVDLHKVELDESGVLPTSWVQGMTLGTYQHPVYGEITFTEERIKRFSDNVNNNVRGTELDIDYDHKEKDGKAAGWVKKAADRGAEGLYLLVEWTQAAAASIKAREYRYFSPEFKDEWTHPKTSQKFKDVLFGGALTNRPFLKDIQPVNLSEAFAELYTEHHPEQEEGMDEETRKRLAKSYGLPDDATEEQIMEAADKQSADRDNNSGGDSSTTTTTTTTGSGPAVDSDQSRTDDGGTGTVAASDGIPADLLKLAENNPAVKWLADKLAEQDKQIQTTQTALRLSEVENMMSKLSESIPPAVSDELRKFMLSATQEQGAAVYKMFENLGQTGLVTLGESGQGAESGNTNDAMKRFEEKVAEKRKADPALTYADAVDAVSLEEPKLFNEAWDSAPTYTGSEG